VLAEASVPIPKLGTGVWLAFSAGREYGLQARTPTRRTGRLAKIVRTRDSLSVQRCDLAGFEGKRAQAVVGDVEPRRLDHILACLR
jgi:hypothetical protein